MSFYGTIYKQISNAFDRFFVKNSGKNKKEFLDSPKNSVEIKADGREGYLDFDSGNRWIQMEGDYTNNFCKIYHAQADATNLNTYNTVTKVNSATEPIDVSLDEDTYLEIKGVKYDKAGHVSGTKSQYLKFNRVNAEVELEEMRKDIGDFKAEVEKTIEEFDGRLIKTEEFKKQYDERLAEEEKKSTNFRTDINTNSDSIDEINKFIGDSSKLGVDLSKEDLCSIIGDFKKLREDLNMSNTTTLYEIIKSMDAQINVLMLAVGIK